MAAFEFNPNDLHRLHRLMFAARGVATLDAEGAHRTRQSGEGTDFLDFRPYVPGDDFRRIDWTLYGRFRQLFVRRLESARQVSVTLLIDASRSMAFGSPVPKILQAQRLACALAWVALQGGDRLFVSSYGGGESLPTLGPLAGRGAMPAVVRFMRQLAPAGKSDLATGVRQLQSRRGTRRGLVVVISDFLDGSDPEPPLSTLLAAGGKVLAVQVIDEVDRGVGVSGSLRLTDSETGRRIDVRVDSASLARYRQRFDDRLTRLEQFCLRRGQHYLRVSTSDHYIERLCDALRTGVLVR